MAFGQEDSTLSQADNAAATGRRSVTARALALLDVFDGKNRRLSLSKIARLAELPLATTHRYLSDLVEGKALIRDPEDGLYEVGSWTWSLGMLHQNSELRDLALPWLLELYIETGLTVHFSILDDTETFYLEKLPARGNIARASRAGGHLPAFATASGQVLLAHAGVDVQSRVSHEMFAYTRQTIVSKSALDSRLLQVRHEGFAVSDGELSPGVQSVAVPVSDMFGSVVASMGLTFESGSHPPMKVAMPLNRYAKVVQRQLSSIGSVRSLPLEYVQSQSLRRGRSRMGNETQ